LYNNEMSPIDLNCDLGEGFGVYSLGRDAEIMPFISSANIACGFHAGDPMVMVRTVRLVKQHGVKVGAHPGYPDLQGFGRRPMDLLPEEVEALMLYQLGALAGICHAEGVEMIHVKPHGALYNQAAKDRSLARVIAQTTARFQRSLILFGLAGSVLIEEGRAAGLEVAAEGFADRAYEPDGSLRSRRLSGAILTNPDEVARHAAVIAKEGVRLEKEGKIQHIKIQTICLHGDEPNAVENAKAVKIALNNI
jgi:UPF0271 protein